MKLRRLEQIFDRTQLPSPYAGLVRVNDEDSIVKLYFPLSCFGIIEDSMILDAIKRLYPDRDVEFGFWHGPAHIELASDVEFGQLTRAVLFRSELFWNMETVTLIVDRALFNLALGDFVRKQIKEAVAKVCKGNINVIIQCKK